MNTHTAIPNFVSEAAMMKRLRRAMRKEGSQLVRTPARFRDRDGEYLVCQLNSNRVIDKCLNPEVWAREMGVLKPNEMVAA
jgi:hypothetical protein